MNTTAKKRMFCGALLLIALCFFANYLNNKAIDDQIVARFSAPETVYEAESFSLIGMEEDYWGVRYGHNWYTILDVNACKRIGKIEDQSPMIRIAFAELNDMYIYEDGKIAVYNGYGGWGRFWEVNTVYYQAPSTLAEEVIAYCKQNGQIQGQPDRTAQPK